MDFDVFCVCFIEFFDFRSNFPFSSDFLPDFYHFPSIFAEFSPFLCHFVPFCYVFLPFYAIL
jgi:hypothetical protein